MLQTLGNGGGHTPWSRAGRGTKESWLSARHQLQSVPSGEGAGEGVDLVCSACGQKGPGSQRTPSDRETQASRMAAKMGTMHSPELAS